LRGVGSLSCALKSEVKHLQPVPPGSGVTLRPKSRKESCIDRSKLLPNPIGHALEVLLREGNVPARIKTIPPEFPLLSTKLGSNCATHSTPYFRAFASPCSPCRRLTAGKSYASCQILNSRAVKRTVPEPPRRITFRDPVPGTGRSSAMRRASRSNTPGVPSASPNRGHAPIASPPERFNPKTLPNARETASGIVLR
jgi:hypothetical protein